MWREGKVFGAERSTTAARVHGGEISSPRRGATGKSAFTFNLPYDITVAPDGALYVIEYGAGRLTKVSPDGKLLGRYGSSGTGEAQFATPWGLTADSRMRVLVADTKNRRIVALQL